MIKKSPEKEKKSLSNLTLYGGGSVFKERKEWNDSMFITVSIKRCFMHGSWVSS